MWHSKLNKCDSGVVGNARPCQGRDRGFEPRLSLLFNKKRTSGKDVLFRRKSPIRGSKFERLRSTAVGAEQVSTGHLAPSIASVQQKKDIRKGCPFSSKEPHPGLKVRASPFHCGRRKAGVHRTPCAVYRFCSTKRTFGKDYDKEYSSFIIFVNDMKKTILGLIKKLFNNIILRQK